MDFRKSERLWERQEFFIDDIELSKRGSKMPIIIESEKINLEELEKMQNKTDEKESDEISKPSHYCEGRKYEPKDVIRDWSLNFNLGNVVKYISRNGRKSGESSLKDLQKARQYLDFEIEALNE